MDAAANDAANAAARNPFASLASSTPSSAAPATSTGAPATPAAPTAPNTSPLPNPWAPPASQGPAGDKPDIAGVPDRPTLAEWLEVIVCQSHVSVGGSDHTAFHSGRALLTVRGSWVCQNPLSHDGQAQTLCCLSPQAAPSNILTWDGGGN